MVMKTPTVLAAATRPGDKGKEQTLGSSSNTNEADRDQGRFIDDGLAGA